MTKATLLPNEKTYAFQTIDQDGSIESHEIEAFSLKEAKKYIAEFIGNARDGSRKVGQITRAKNY